MSGFFSDEFNDRYEHLENMLRWCLLNGGNPEKDMPEAYKEYEDMELIYQTEFF
jgi:hypothetical protein